MVKTHTNIGFNNSLDIAGAKEGDMKRPILVTGSHRSGTTWVGRMLCAGGDAFYIHEPFNARAAGPVWLPKKFPYWYFYFTSENAAEYENALENVMNLRYPVLDGIRKVRNLRYLLRLGRDSFASLNARLQDERPLVKDPLALFSAEWLAERFNMQVIIMIRHPLAFASSLKRLDWQFNFENWSKQKALMDDLLSPFRDQIMEYSRDKDRDIIDQSILMWNAIYSVVHRYQQTHPDWFFIKHEQLAMDPIQGFKELYRYCGLEWNTRARTRVLSYSDGKNVKEVSHADLGTIKRDSKATIGTWQQRLTQSEIRRIRAKTRDVARLFYVDD